jgi:hypothetical protein
MICHFSYITKLRKNNKKIPALKAIANKQASKQATLKGLISKLIHLP